MTKPIMSIKILEDFTTYTDADDDWITEHVPEAWEAREVLNYITELEAAQRWIPVSERLPELDQDVFAVVEGEIVKGHFYQDFDGVTHFSTDDDALLVATHWFPMPQLPEERER